MIETGVCQWHVLAQDFRHGHGLVAGRNCWHRHEWSVFSDLDFANDVTLLTELLELVPALETMHQRLHLLGLSWTDRTQKFLMKFTCSRNFRNKTCASDFRKCAMTLENWNTKVAFKSDFWNEMRRRPLVVAMHCSRSCCTGLSYPCLWCRVCWGPSWKNWTIDKSCCEWSIHGGSRRRCGAGAWTQCWSLWYWVCSEWCSSADSTARLVVLGDHIRCAMIRISLNQAAMQYCTCTFIQKI